jgi:Protein of unknown function (DUF2934)
MHLSPPIHHPAAGLAPSHDEIVACAREIWNVSGQPEGRDEEIWMDAERRLISAGRAPLEAGAISVSSIRKHTHPLPLRCR